MTSLALIVPGNPNLETLASVLVIVQKHFSSPLDSVFLIDTDGSTTGKNGESLESQRNELIRRLTHTHVLIAQRSFAAETLAMAIPRAVSEELSRVPPERVVVDLTNGTKTMSSLLYATASLLQLERLFFLTVLPSGRSKKAERLEDEDYRVDVLHPLQDINALKPFALFELVYYRQEMTELVTQLNERFADKTERMGTIARAVDDAVGKYFQGDVRGAANSAGLAGESLAQLVIALAERKSKGALLQKAEKGAHADRVNTIQSRLEVPMRTGLKDEDTLVGPLRELLPLRYVGGYLSVLHQIRNDTAHPRALVSIERDEARLALDLVRLIVRSLLSVE